MCIKGSYLVKRGNNLILCVLQGPLKKSFFNHLEHKECTKDTKLKPCIIALCDLCVKPL